jgi:hypothetical protein
LGGCKKRYKKSIAAAAVLHVKVGAQVVVTLDWLAINFFFGQREDAKMALGLELTIK